MSRTREVAAHGLADEHGAHHIAARHDALFLDLDGVIYRGDRVIEGVPDVLRRLRGTGSKLLFITNNSSKTPEQVAAKLAGMGIEARPEEVLTSALATASMLRREGYEGKDAFVVGERGIVEALRAVGIRTVDGLVQDPV
jgi:HAD superfamily hydrolase (TIGR01450 family)